jgi:transposase
MSLFRISDRLIKSQSKIEHNLYMNIASLFSIQQTVALYDLTNTFFEGAATENIKAARGFSKEKRSDCPLVTLALVLDGHGFIQKSKMFPGNVAEGNTLQGMLKKLNASPQAMIIMDRGIATKDNLKYLTDNNFRYLVISRSRLREFDFTQAQTIQTAGGDDIQVYKSVNAENTEAYLNCYSPKRKGKEQGIIERFMKKYELGLQSISNALSKPRSNKSKDKILQRIGRLQEKSRGIHQHYKIVINDNAASKEQNQVHPVQEYFAEAGEASAQAHQGNDSPLPPRRNGPFDLMALPVKGTLCRYAPLTGFAIRSAGACDCGSGGMQTFWRQTCRLGVCPKALQGRHLTQKYSQAG